MIFLVIMALAVMAVIFCVVDKSRLRLSVAGMYLALIIIISSYALIWSKNGGIGDSLKFVLAFSGSMERFMLYYPISAAALSKLLVFGKSLFLTSSLMTAAGIAPTLKARWKPVLGVTAGLEGLLNYILLHPSVYELYCRTPFFVEHQIAIFNWIRVFYLAHVVACIALMLMHYGSIQIRWMRKRFSYILPLMVNLLFLFVFFAVLGPIQVSHFTGIYYVHSNFLYMSTSIPWVLLMLVSIVCICLGSGALWSYSRLARRIGSPDITISKKLRESNAGVKVFTHGMKNELLVMRAMLRDFKKDTTLSEESRNRVDGLSEVCEDMMLRMDNMYHAFVNKAMILMETEYPAEIVEAAVRRVNSSVPIRVECREQRTILADAHYLEEAIYNILKNSVDSIEAKGPGDGDEVAVIIYLYGSDLVLEVTDTGEGIPEKKRRKIFEPFYTEKNSKDNWGMGLPYAHQIIKAHFGRITLESRVGEGTNVYIMIPTYRIERQEEN